METRPAESSPAPILDRLEPLPRPAPRWRGFAGTFAVALAAGGALGALAAGQPAVLRMAPWELGPWLQAAFERPLLAFFLIVTLASGAATALVTGAELVAGRIAGMRLRRTDLGHFLPRSHERLAGRLLAATLAGPVTGLLVAILLWLLPFPLGFGLECFALLCALIGLCLGVPLPTRPMARPGTLLWARLCDQPRWERHLALLGLLNELDTGVLPEHYSRELLGRATAVRDESSETVMAHSLAQSHARATQRWEDERAFLETALRHSRATDRVTREALRSDAAVWQARRRKRIDLAEAWLAELPARPKVRWLRTRVEAALLEARGDREGALAKLAEVEQELRRLPPGGARATLLASCERWRSGLAQTL